MRSDARGFTFVDLIVSSACGVVVLVCAAIAFAQVAADPKGSGAGGAKSLKDAAQLRGIHQSYLVFAREFQGIMPRPGLIDRLPFNGQEQPGRGEEDITQNTTAALHSACIMQNYYPPEIVISPIERNPRVKDKVDADYDFEKFNVMPNVDCYWDPAFKADLATESNVSYANLVIFGKRMEDQWKASMDAKFAVLGNRGPKDGAIDPDSLTCGPHGNWAGNVAFNDNHIEFLDATQPPALMFKTADGESKPDNLFRIDDGMNGCDVILSFTKAMSKDGAELQWD